MHIWVFDLRKTWCCIIQLLKNSCISRLLVKVVTPHNMGALIQSIDGLREKTEIPKKEVILTPDHN